MSNPKIIEKIGLLVFKDKKFLMVRSHKNEEVFYLLGGKIDKDESDIECIKREVKEEINCDVDETGITFLNEFQDVAHGKENTLLKIRVYKGELIGHPKASSEIAEVGWFDSNSPKKHFSEVAQRKYLPWLRNNGYIN